jgi:hypothetical protein
LIAQQAFGARSIQVRFIGCEGDRAELVHRLAREAEVSQAISVVGILPHAEATRAMCQADVLLLLDSPGRMSGVPAKLYEFLGAGRPVLALAEQGGDVDWVLKQSRRRYRIAPPRDPAAIRRALRDLICNDEPGSLEDDASSLPNRFIRELLAGDLARVLADCVDGTAEHVSAEGFVVG